LTQQPRDTPQFYLTAPTPCPYLAGQFERKVFTHLVGQRAPQLNDILTQGGFRRSQSIAYRPACETCRACISVRVPVADFRPNRSFRRGMMKNAYLDSRHRAGGMADMTVLDYAMMVEDSHVKTRVVEYRKRDIDTAITGRSKGDLVAAVLTDILGDGLSLVYSFFEPDQAARSLGTLVILDHIARAKTMGLPYVYLGYWVQGSPKMDYKARFLPQERLMPEGWFRVEA